MTRRLVRHELVLFVKSRARIMIIDPRRTVTVDACEVEAGKENVFHLNLERSSAVQRPVQTAPCYITLFPHRFWQNTFVWRLG